MSKPAYSGKGLSTKEALKKLINEISALLPKEKWAKERWLSLIRTSLSSGTEESLFPWPNLILSAIYFLILFVVGCHTGDLWIIVESLVILFFAAGNVFLNLHSLYMTKTEMHRRVQNVLEKLEWNYANDISWTPDNYPHLHTPLSASVVLQWTIRDGHKVNLPWAMLVQNDFIFLKPGQVAPGRCHSLENPNIVVNKGEILHLLPDHPGSANVSPIPEFKPPVEPQLFIIDETPYTQVVKTVLQRHNLNRPSSRLTKYQHLFFVQLLAQLLAPASLVLTMICNVVRYYQHPQAHNFMQLLVLHPIATSLPMVSLSFPLYWIVANYVALAKVMNDYLSFRHVHVTDDPFDDTPGHQQPNLILERAKQASDPNSLRNSFFSALLGQGQYLSRSENLIHVLGSITALCCTDKKGILSWPNTSAEKLFILRPESSETRVYSNADTASQSSNTCQDAGPESRPERGIVPEILTITHDIRNPYKVEFDDPSWRQYLTSLKPLGLGILLNTCNLSTEEKYTNFFNYLICESIRLENQAKEDEDEKPDTVQDNDHTDKNHHVGIELLPIVTRGCLCELAKKIGFEPGKVEAGYQFTNQLQTFRHVWGSFDDAGITSKFIRNLHLAHLKFPFPHMVSVTMHEKSAIPSTHLITQGTADIILDSCIDAWTGQDLMPLSEDTRKKILDFYQRASLSSYCTAFSYRPLLMSLPWKSVNEYLQLPSHTYPFYWKYTDNAEMADVDVVQNVGHISLGVANSSAAAEEQKDETHTKTLDDALACLELECNQTFLGMVQMQYQPLVDIVQLIDLLEKACIRFVHFSKENELRSRVFSEKMGLESGWNCHISLQSNDNAAMRKTVSYQCHPGYQSGKKKSGKRAAVAARNDKLIGCSLPDKLERHPWYLDFPRWHETRRGGCVANNGDKTFASAAQLKAATLQFDLAHLGYTPNFANDFRKNSTVSAAQASVTSDSDPFDYDMSNRAQLPKGIENIRPHLESMDNVPLLVSLFTDCTPENTKEMVQIMQEYGEVVCVLGSAANHHNTRVFMQADASLAIEPLYPQVCQDVPVYKAPANSPSPTSIAQTLNSVGSSLSFTMEDEVSIFHLILESRHFSLCLLNAMQFWASALIFIMLAQASSQLLTLPLFLSPGQILYLTILVIPMLSMSLLGPKSPDKDIMNISTGKNQVVVDKSSVKYSIIYYGMKFVPALGVLVICHVWAGATNPEFCNDHLNLVMTIAYLIVISLSFLFRSVHLWQRHPGHNTVYLWTIFGIFIAQALYSLTAILTVDDFTIPPDACWIVWACGLPIVMAFNELLKRYEIKGEVRYQKRQRLEFGTKLGINSPF